MAKLKKGLVHIYTGEGKGKTTAAIGLGIRAAGCNYRVCMFQFLKDKKFPCGEGDIIKRLGNNFKFKRFDITHPMFKKRSVIEIEVCLKKAIGEVKKVIQGKRFDVVVLDEILVCVSQGFVSEDVILKIIKSKPDEIELVLTGRGATQRLIEHADYVTYMKDVKHPLRVGIKARKGIEF